METRTAHSRVPALQRISIAHRSRSFVFKLPKARLPARAASAAAATGRAMGVIGDCPFQQAYCQIVDDDFLGYENSGAS